jgi:hypothetical protein
MSKFDIILKKSITQLKEGIQDPNNPTIKQAVDVIDKALNTSGQINANANAKDLASTLFGTSPDDSTNPLHSAFDKIKQNPENPNLEDHEKEAYLALANKMQPKQEEPEKKEDQTNKQTSSTSTDSDNTTSEQPNATQYNPMNQPKQN